ncbi:hypothetical protein CKM354_000712700 [Cercospora kikuchii]|uniref:Uncharacterized protein n=1 Tax=Cercospora kikuchii TaxID=84275 RepID=A0A9P3CT64_9PEZI|nr:uncharacterized protein CKM354_000712700 [Cercospora kikuchii]GIZ43918.1 hypothetical protein CKM354_000712700 [Cercospora kikuchii]
MLSLLGLNAATNLHTRQEQPSPENSSAEISLMGIGPGGLGISVSNTSDQVLFASANQHPNLTTSASFSFGTKQNLDDDTTWNWRVNITNVDVSPLSDRLAPGQHAANLAADLQWPGGGTFQSYLDRQQDKFGSPNPIVQMEELCLSSSSYSLPANITSRYSGDDDGNCTNVLGQECYASLLAARQDSGPCAGPINNTRWQTLPGCEDAFNVRKIGGGPSIDIANDTQVLIRNYRNESLTSGDPIFHLTYRPLPASDLSSFEAAQSRLNMLYLTGGYSSEPVLLCQVVSPPASSSAPQAHHAKISAFAAAAVVTLLTITTQL